jgi:uncharacterized membrane protein
MSTSTESAEESTQRTGSKVKRWATSGLTFAVQRWKWIVVFTVLWIGFVFLGLVIVDEANYGDPDFAGFLMVVQATLAAALITFLFFRRSSGNLKQRVTELEAANEALSNESARLERRVDRSTQENAELRDELATSRRTLDEMERELETFRGSTAVEVTSTAEEAGARHAVLRNVLDEDRDLAGEIVVHESGARYVLPDDLPFRQGETVRVLAHRSIDAGDTMFLVERLSADTDQE